MFHSLAFILSNLDPRLRSEPHITYMPSHCRSRHRSYAITQR